MIKSRIIIFGLIWAIGHRAVAQPCKKITIDDVTQKKLLNDYIAAVKKGAFVGDKGVVEVTRYLNENGRPSWLIKATIDDSYKDNPPVEWASLDSDIVLFYDATGGSWNNVTKHDPTPELLGCLDEAIEDRLYIRPRRRERLRDIGFKTPSGKPIIINAHRLYGGNVSNSLIVVFEADGSISKFHPV